MAPRSSAPRKSLSDQLRQAIADDGRSHYALAFNAGVDPRQLDRFVSRERSLTLETAGKLAELLGLELSYRRGRRAADRKTGS